MAEGKNSDDRSMGEILASIRKIVSDEEATRRVADEERSRAEATSDAGVFVLTGDMRSGAAAAAARDEAPLELGSGPSKQVTIGNVAEAQEDAAIDFSEPVGLTEEEVEDIVRRVVREELQGPIGQQISRKVKGLIRQEVARAIGEEDALI